MSWEEAMARTSKPRTIRDVENESQGFPSQHAAPAVS